MNWNQALEIGLPTASGAIGWFASRLVQKRKRNNDFLGEMQANIDMLVEKYSDTLKELIELKKQNAELLLGQQSLENELKAVRLQNSKLKSEVDKLTSLVKKTQKPVE